MYRLIILICIFFSMIYAFPGTIFATDKLPVFVTILPQKYFVQQIGKDLVDVQVMVHPGADPHTYEPTPQQMVAISRAKLYFAVGIEFEEAKLDKIIATNPSIKVIHTDHGINKIAMVEHEHEKGEHHEEAEHDKDRHEHAGLDPHIWLSPPLVKIQAHTILTALQEADPQHRSVYEANFKAFTAQIDQLDADLKKIFAGKKGLQFIVFHPAWGYFAHAYGLKQVPIEMEGKNPKPAQLKELIQHARENRIKVVFVQPQFSTQSAKVVAREIGGQVAFADSLAEDWMANIREVAEKFEAALN